MTFVDGFFSYNVNLTDTDRGTYTSLRVKTPKHPYESLEHLTARILAYLHCFEPEQKFTRGLFELKEPTIWKRDILGAVEHWVQVGPPPKKKLARAVRESSSGRCSVYLYALEQINEFCQSLRGSKSNWIADVRFYLICPEILGQLAETTRSSSTWQATFVDGTAYLIVDDIQYQGTIDPIDMWRYYQQSLAAVA